MSLDRVEIESAGSDPRRLANALLDQLPVHDGRMPIEDIARALDIVEIRRRPFQSIEGCLQTDALKSKGVIAVRSTTRLQRQRYTIAHELGHFLNEGHRPVIEQGFVCSGRDLAAPAREGRHQRQELEANTFAIEVLAPRRSLTRYLRPLPDLAHALAIAEKFEISREAGVRRYVDLRGGMLAAVFSHHGRIRYVARSDDFPSLRLWQGNDIASLLPGPVSDELTSMDEADAEAWLTRPNGLDLFSQTRFQADGYAITLLLAEPVEIEEAAPSFRG